MERLDRQVMLYTAKQCQSISWKQEKIQVTIPWEQEAEQIWLWGTDEIEVVGEDNLQIMLQRQLSKPRICMIWQIRSKTGKNAWLQVIWNSMKCYGIYAAEQEMISIGREFRNTISVPQHPLLSGRHVTIKKENQVWCVQDQSTNGFYIDGKKGKKKQKIQVGSHLLLYGIEIALREKTLEIWESGVWEFQVGLKKEKENKEKQEVILTNIDVQTPSKRTAPKSWWNRLVYKKQYKKSVEDCGWLDYASDFFEKIESRWLQHIHQTDLVCVLGRNRQGKFISVDLHETGIGPHGLLCGMTGQGKSQCLQSLVLGLCASYGPKQLQVIVIDWKKSGIGEKVKVLPHVIGTLTNTHMEDWWRAKDALEALVRERDTLLMNSGVNHIDQYNALHEEEDRLPYMFVVVDEYAQMQQTCPALAETIVSMVRVGRSLGLHILLSSQTLTEVVAEEIQANAGYELAFFQKGEGQGEKQSAQWTAGQEEIRIWQVGHGILKTCKEEIPFQSIWSEKSLIQSKHVTYCKHKVEQIYETEGDLCIDRLLQLAEKWGLNEMPPLWQKPLEAAYPLQIFSQDTKMGWYMGMCDASKERRQYAMLLPWEQMGHLAFVGKEGMGKTNALLQLVVQACMQHAPVEWQVSVLTTNPGEWEEIGEAKHILGIADTVETMRQILYLWQQELQQRQSKVNLEKEAKWVLCIDDWEIFSQMTRQQYTKQILSLFAQGKAVKMYVAVTALTLDSLPIPTMKSVSHLFGFGEEKATILQRYGYYFPLYERQSIPGRAVMIQKQETFLCQFYHWCPTKEQLQIFRKQQADWGKKSKGEGANSFCLLPQKLGWDYFLQLVNPKEYFQEQQAYPLGLEALTGKIFALSSKVRTCILVWEQEKEKKILQELLGKLIQVLPGLHYLDLEAYLAEEKFTGAKEEDAWCLCLVGQEAYRRAREHTGFVKLLEEADGIYMGSRLLEQRFFPVNFDTLAQASAELYQKGIWYFSKETGEMKQVQLPLYE